MKPQWLTDNRMVPREVMEYMRIRAVCSIREGGQSPEVVAKAFGIHRSSVYEWLEQFDCGGYEALKSHSAPGAKPIISSEMDLFLKEIALKCTPEDFGFDTNLWTRHIFSEILKKEYGVAVSLAAIGLHLKQLGLSYQVPCYRDIERDDKEIAKFLRVKFPMIQRLAKRMNADIAFEDEAGIGVSTHTGRTWGMKCHPPEVRVSMRHGGYNMLSIVSPLGDMQYLITDKKVNSEEFIGFLSAIIAERSNPLILLVDHASFHKSAEVREFVRLHRGKIRIFFLPRRAPELNPDEQVWNTIKTKRVGKQPIKNKADLKERLRLALDSLQANITLIKSFFQLPDTQYAAYACREIS